MSFEFNDFEMINAGNVNTIFLALGTSLGTWKYCWNEKCEWFEMDSDRRYKVILIK